MEEPQPIAAAQGDDTDVFAYYAEPPLVSANLFHLRGDEWRLCVIRKHVSIIALRGGDALALLDVLQRAQQIAIGGGLLEKLLFCGGGHALIETLHQIMAFTLEKHPGIARRLGIALIAGESVHAWALAAFDVILQARPRMTARQIHRAARHQETLVNEMQNAPSQARGKIRPKIK